MTLDQVNALTPAERNCKIAEILGWKRWYSIIREEDRWYSPDRKEDYLHPPNYCGSLDAMREAWNSKIKSNSIYEDAFTFHLLVVCEIENPGVEEYPDYSLSDVAVISNASSDQRSKAFLMVILP